MSKIFECAAQWWTDRLRNRDGNVDVGDPHLNSLQALAMKGAPEVPEEQIQAFRDLLLKHLQEAWEGRRDHDREDRSSPFSVSIGVDYEPKGLLWSIVKELGLPMSIWPAKTTMFVQGWKVILRDPWEGDEILLEDPELLEKGSPEHYERCLAKVEIQAFPITREITPEEYQASSRDYETRVQKLGERYEDLMDEFRAEQIAHLRRMCGQYRLANHMLHEEPGLPEHEIKWERGKIVETLVAYQLMCEECQTGFKAPGEIERL